VYLRDTYGADTLGEAKRFVREGKIQPAVVELFLEEDMIQGGYLSGLFMEAYPEYFETKTVVRTQTPAGSRGNFRIDMMVSCLEGVIRGEQNLKKKRNLHNHVGVYRYLQDKYGLVEVEEAPNVFLERRIPANVVALFLEEGMLGKSRLYNAARQGYPELFG